MNQEDLLDLLNSSRERNLEHNITGMLVYHKKSFIQVLEGEKEKVQQLFTNIQNDSRHSNVYSFWEAEIPELKFSSWTMGFKNLTDLKPEELEGFSDFLETGFSQDLVRKDPSVGQSLLMLMSKSLPA